MRDTCPTGFTTSEVAKRFRVSTDKILSWIRRGELAAINTSTSLLARPRFIILPEALAAFEQKRIVGPPPVKPRRRKQTVLVDFYPDHPG
jgi:hypothetical protein